MEEVCTGQGAWPVACVSTFGGHRCSRAWLFRVWSFLAPRLQTPDLGASARAGDARSCGRPAACAQSLQRPQPEKDIGSWHLGWTPDTLVQLLQVQTWDRKTRPSCKGDVYTGSKAGVGGSISRVLGISKVGHSDRTCGAFVSGCGGSLGLEEGGRTFQAESVSLSPLRSDLLRSSCAAGSLAKRGVGARQVGGETPRSPILGPLHPEESRETWRGSRLLKLGERGDQVTEASLSFSF